MMVSSLKFDPCIMMTVSLVANCIMGEQMHDGKGRWLFSIKQGSRLLLAPSIHPIHHWPVAI